MTPADPAQLRDQCTPNILRLEAFRKLDHILLALLSVLPSFDSSISRGCHAKYNLLYLLYENNFRRESTLPLIIHYAAVLT